MYKTRSVAEKGPLLLTVSGDFMRTIHSLLSFARRRIVQIVLWFYTAGSKLRQQREVRGERQPRFESDEIVVPAHGDMYAIVVKYAGHGESANLHVLLDALRRAQVNTVLVCNGEVPPEELRALSQRVHRVMVRRNIGRDFGAYRAATLSLLSQGVKPERMMYFNDSLLYIEGTELDRLVAEFIFSEFDVVGLGENQYQHHVGSYALSVSGAAFTHPKFRQFWQDYIPYDLRKHTIHAGELGLTGVLKDLSCSIDVVYDVTRLARKLGSMPLHEVVDAMRWLPFGFRRHALMDVLGQSISARGMILNAGALEGSAAAHDAPAAGQRPAGTPTLGAMRSLRDADGRVALLNRETPAVRATPKTSASEGMAQSAQRLSRQLLIDHILEHVTNGSQLHFGFGLFYRLLGCPVVKRDLFSRGLYREHDCADILDNVPAPTRQRLLRDLINRGRLDMQLGRWRGMLFRNGML
ncbi:hypothetical protein SAMN05443580_12218 [Variovorax sp. OV084]|jgi:hypothetical protein|nr:hypothetical protein SAMN05443580_12218 [Variovorax sp. OV084]